MRMIIGVAQRGSLHGTGSGLRRIAMVRRSGLLRV
jgi:hypothetical protein